MRHPIIAQDCAAALEATSQLWDQVRGQRIFVTGGTGFFGSWFLELLTFAADSQRFDFEAVVLTRDPEAFARGPAGHLARHRCIRTHLGDVRDFEFPVGPFTLMAHFGSTGPKSLGQQPEEFFDLITLGTRRVLNFAEQVGTKRLLLASSGAVYGSHPTGKLRGVNEDYRGAPDPTNPMSANAEGKRVAEFLCAALTRRRPDLAVGIARGFSFVGPYLPQNSGFAVVDFLEAAKTGKGLSIQGDGTPVRSYLYGADLSVWLWTILLRAQPGAARAWNVGSEEPVSIRDLANQVARADPRPLPVTVVGKPVVGQTRHVYLPDTARARVELGLTQRISLPEAIGRTLDWLRSSD